MREISKFWGWPQSPVAYNKKSVSSLAEVDAAEIYHLLVDNFIKEIEITRPSTFGKVRHIACLPVSTHTTLDTLFLGGKHLLYSGMVFSCNTFTMETNRKVLVMVLRLLTATTGNTKREEMVKFLVLP